MSRTLTALFASVVCLGLGACGGEAESGASATGSPAKAGSVRWDAPPEIGTPKLLPDDRVLAGAIRNDSPHLLELSDEDVKLLDAQGRPVFHTIRFSAGFGRDIYPPRYGRKIPEKDRIRLGYQAQVAPGEARPVTIAWRVKDPSRAPVRVELPGGVLSLPPD